MAEQKNDFKVVADYMFKSKSLYHKLSDEDKFNAFFKINQKIACAFPKRANSLNHKSADRSTSIDIWNIYFMKKEFSIPSWYWVKVEKNTTIVKDYTKREVEIFKKYNEEINPRDIDFVLKHFKDEVKQEIKFLSKFED